VIFQIETRVLCRLLRGVVHAHVNNGQRSIGVKITDFVIRHGIPPLAEISDAPSDIKKMNGMWRSSELSLFKTGQMRREWGARNAPHKGTKKQTRYRIEF
jgi:hypothetical protein